MNDLAVIIRKLKELEERIKRLEELTLNSYLPKKKKTRVKSL